MGVYRKHGSVRLGFVRRTQLMEASVNNLIQQLIKGDNYGPVTPAAQRIVNKSRAA